MKRFLSLMAFCAICCSPAFAQEAEPVNNYPQLTVTARIDYPVLPYLYTLLEGDLGDHFSYSFSNHWLSDSSADLYSNTFLASELDWCDWANITASAGNWSLTVGKDMLAIGTLEEDAYDVDSYWEMNSQFWNNTQVYQWGGKVSYTTDSENTTASFQLASSPFDFKPFENRLKTWSLYLNGEYGFYHPIWSLNMIQYDVDGKYMKVFASGNQFNAADWLSLGIDYVLRNTESHFGHDITLSADFFIGDKLELLVKGGFETQSCPALREDLLEIPEKYTFGGLCLQYYPLRDSQDLRIHALASANKAPDPLSSTDWNFLLSAGITYNFSISNLLFNR